MWHEGEQMIKEFINVLVKYPFLNRKLNIFYMHSSKVGEQFSKVFIPFFCSVSHLQYVLSVSYNLWNHLSCLNIEDDWIFKHI